MTMFDDYARASGSIAMRICFESTMIDSRASHLNPKIIASLTESESVESFVSYLRTLQPASADYWPQVYKRIGLPFCQASETRHELSEQGADEIAAENARTTCANEAILKESQTDSTGVRQLKFNCPHCTQRVSAPDEMQGVEMLCPACSGVVTIPIIEHRENPDTIWFLIYGCFWSYVAFCGIGMFLRYVSQAFPVADPEKQAAYWTGLILSSMSAIGFGYCAYQLFSCNAKKPMIIVLICLHAIITIGKSTPFNIVVFLLLTWPMIGVIRNMSSKKISVLPML